MAESRHSPAPAGTLLTIETIDGRETLMAILQNQPQWELISTHWRNLSVGAAKHDRRPTSGHSQAGANVVSFAAHQDELEGNLRPPHELMVWPKTCLLTIFRNTVDLTAPTLSPSFSRSASKVAAYKPP